jgi:hypothetical protein
MRTGTGRSHDGKENASLMTIAAVDGWRVPDPVPDRMLYEMLESPGVSTPRSGL